MAELREEILFKQPENSHRGDCPICFLPLEIDESETTIYSCCCKRICNGCSYSNQVREVERKLEHKCPFCRQPVQQRRQHRDLIMERVEANDPAAIYEKGMLYYEMKGTIRLLLNT